MNPVKEPGTRNHTADLLKGMAVLAMIQVHLTELFARQEFYDSFTGKLSLFIGGVPAAPVFMTVMGYFLVSSGSLISFIKRGLKLIFWGLLLNIGLNFHLILDVWSGTKQANLLQYIFGADILFLAGLSIILISLLKLIFKKSFIPYFILALVFSFLGQVIPVISDSKLQFLMAFAGGNYSWSYFPLFPWLAYPLAGYTFGLVKDKIKKITDTRNSIIFIIAFVLFVSGMVLFGYQASTNLEQYYHHGILFFIWAVTFIICWGWLNSYIAEKSGFFILIRYIGWLGKNVTAIFIIQWLIIGNLATQIWKTQTGGELILWGLGILTVTSLIVYIKNRIKKVYYDRKELT